MIGIRLTIIRYLTNSFEAGKRNFIFGTVLYNLIGVILFGLKFNNIMIYAMNYHVTSFNVYSALIKNFSLTLYSNTI